MGARVSTIDEEDYGAALRDLKSSKIMSDVETMKTERARVRKEDIKLVFF